MYVIGLTGNVATGKSTVATMLESLGAQAIDADVLAHRTMRAGTLVHERIVARFGPGILSQDGEIDRGDLGARVFADPDALADLERIVHPAVVDETLSMLARSDKSVVVVEAIKLLEAEMHRHAHAVWVVTAPRSQQLQRLVKSRHMTPAQAALRIDAQPPSAEKERRADVLIDNSIHLRITWLQVLRAWNALPGVTRVPYDLAPSTMA